MYTPPDPWYTRNVHPSTDKYTPSAVPVLSLAEVARRAIDALDERGWCQRTKLNDYGSVCAMGALGQASSGHPLQGVLREHHTVIARADEYAAELCPDRVDDFVTYGYRSDGIMCHALSSVVRVNDHKDTTVEDVRTIFEKTALYFEEHAQ